MPPQVFELLLSFSLSPPLSPSTCSFARGPAHAAPGPPWRHPLLLPPPPPLAATTPVSVVPCCVPCQILEAKVRKLEQLVRLKDAKIQTLTAKLQAADLA